MTRETPTIQPAVEPPRSQLPTDGDEAGLYVYCVVRAGGHHIFGPIGLDGCTVYTMASGGLAAVVHDCRPEPYQSKDPQVVEAWVVAHQKVVAAAAEAFGTVLPMAFDMIVHGPEKGDILNFPGELACPSSAGSGAGKLRMSPFSALTGWLNEKRERFTRLLDKLAGQAEYGVQLFWDRERIAAALIESDPELRALRDAARSSDTPRGAAHLLGQRLAKAVRSAVQGRADQFARDAYARIRRCAADLRIERIKKDEGGRQMLLNLSCLLRRDGGAVGALGRVLDEIQSAEGVSARFTGPWPPYSFVGG